ncbi:hypothetical protein FHW96_000280 [Novosphingobium sp. SG751A]|nr:hypothetical protein [Novosphingobium sp. SG751A]
MRNSTDGYEAFIHGMIALGHDRHWLRRNEAALRRRFARDGMPFPPLPEPEPRGRDRYEGL